MVCNGMAVKLYLKKINYIIVAKSTTSAEGNIGARC